MIILGIDPGIARIGWGIIEEVLGKQNIIEYGCFETKASEKEENRLAQVNVFINDLIKKYQPTAIAIEQLFFASNAKTAFTVGQARGVIVAAGAGAQIPMASYTPLQVKLAISGYGRADKKQMQELVKKLLGLKIIPKPDDAADALAVALTHAYTYRLQQKII